MFKKQKAAASRIELLRSVPLFEGVPDPVLERLLGHVDEVEVAQGERIITEGTDAYRAFVVADGTAQIRVDHQVVGEASAGELIGEVALLEHSKRTATVSALTPMRLLAIGGEGLEWLFADESMSTRVRDSLSKHLGGPRTSR
jgi:CRP/FNR family cyclic AMP-dependent transcriptional regulator